MIDQPEARGRTPGNICDGQIRHELAAGLQDDGSTTLLIEIHAKMAPARSGRNLLQRSEVRLLGGFPEQHQLTIPDFETEGAIVPFTLAPTAEQYGNERVK